jgi:hypothetical protein
MSIDEKSPMRVSMEWLWKRAMACSHQLTITIRIMRVESRIQSSKHSFAMAIATIQKGAL